MYGGPIVERRCEKNIIARRCAVKITIPNEQKIRRAESSPWRNELRGSPNATAAADVHHGMPSAPPSPTTTVRGGKNYLREAFRKRTTRFRKNPKSDTDKQHSSFANSRGGEAYTTIPLMGSTSSVSTYQYLKEN